ncbi:hypothetical protein BDV10DRAFT_186193 [Aspergillus recurvatus]
MAQFETCTTLAGDVVIDGEYDGPIMLSNMVYMNEAKRGSHNVPCPRVGVIDAPKLMHTGELDILRLAGTVAIDPSSLVEMRDLNIMRARLDSASLSNLRGFSTVLVHSRSNFGCDAFTTELEENSAYPEDGSSVTRVSVDTIGISKTAKIMIGIWVQFGVAILVLVGNLDQEKAA